MSMEDSLKKNSKLVGQDWERKMIRSASGIMGKPLARLLRQMDVTESRTQPVYLLDSACGTGNLANEAMRILPRDILEQGSIVCADNSQLSVDIVKRRIEREGWIRTEARLLDATKTDLPSGSFSHVGIGFAMHMIPDGDTVIKDSIRLLKPGGYLGITTMHQDNKAWGPDFRSSMASFPFEAPFPDQVPMQTHENGRWYDPEWVRQKLDSYNLRHVQVTTMDSVYHVDSAAAFVDTFSVMLPWITSRYWSEETRREHSLDEVKELIEKHLEQKWGGVGWNQDWKFIIATAQVA